LCSIFSDDGDSTLGRLPSRHDGGDIADNLGSWDSRGKAAVPAPAAGMTAVLAVMALGLPVPATPRSAYTFFVAPSPYKATQVAANREESVALLVETASASADSS